MPHFRPIVEDWCGDPSPTPEGAAGRTRLLLPGACCGNNFSSRFVHHHFLFKYIAEHALLALETFQSNAKATKYTERGLFSSVIAPTVAPAQLFIRTAPLQNQPDWNRNFQHTVYAGLRNEFDLKTLMAPSNRAVLHQIKNFPQVRAPLIFWQLVITDALQRCPC